MIAILHPFAKVLVRYNSDDKKGEWYTDFIDHKRGDKLLTMFNGNWDEIIPYNSDTRHLLGTTNDCHTDYELRFEL